MADQSAELRRFAEANAWLNGANKRLRREAKEQRIRAEAAERAVRAQRLELDNLANRLRDQRR